jgi:hypothetical protein
MCTNLDCSGPGIWEGQEIDLAEAEREALIEEARIKYLISVGAL